MQGVGVLAQRQAHGRALFVLACFCHVTASGNAVEAKKHAGAD